MIDMVAKTKYTTYTSTHFHCICALVWPRPSCPIPGVALSCHCTPDHSQGSRYRRQGARCVGLAAPLRPHRDPVAAASRASSQLAGSHVWLRGWV